jgi:hypothetical protein
MILDRALTLDLLELALRVASEGHPWKDQRRLLAMALRDRVSQQESEGKTKKCLTRVWLNPPDRAREMIGWARDNAGLFTDRRLMHLGALLATYPFAGSVAAIIGRALALDGSVDAREVRRRACAIWGDRSTVDVGARKVYTTLRALNVLTNRHGGPLERCEPLMVDVCVADWLVHCLVLTRDASAVAESELATAPEMFWTAPQRLSGHYPFLERHSEGGQRVVWVPIHGERERE